MTPDTSDDDRTVIRPTAMPADAGFQKTSWGAPPAASDRTQIAAGPPAFQEDMAGNLPVGTRLGEFEITKLIGEGGFGIVYLAHDHSLERRVALKEYMPSSLATRAGGSQVIVKSERHRETFEAGLKSFINEARLLASFDHPSLVKVYRFWEANGTAYMVMPFLEGTTLKDVLREMRRSGTLPDEGWLNSVLGPLSEALLVIHAEHCYHRDIAPDNVMLLPEKNRWLLLDFGAARRVISEHTQALTVILKPGYAPVEQYAEIPGMKQGPWTDVYALAAVVYFAIMGKTPPPSVGRLLNDTYVPLSQAAAGRYSDQFLAAVDRALAVRPEQRTQSIGELRQDLGLGEVAFDAYATKPLPQGTEMPQRNADRGERTMALPSAFANPPRTGMPQTQARAPMAAPMQAAPAAPAMLAAAAAPRKGGGAMVGVGIGVAVLAVVGAGAYVMLSPSSKPAPAVAVVTPAAVLPTPTPAQASPAPAPAPVAAPAAVPIAAPVAGPLDVAREFDRIVGGQAASFGVRAETKKSELRVGKDEFRFSVSAEREGYLYIFGYSPDGTLAQLVPNSMGGSVKIKKGQAWRFPTGDGFVLESQEPAGPTTLLVMVSAWQRNHEALKPKLESHIKMFPTDAAAGALAARWEGSSSALAGKALCPNGTSCTDEYGAVLLRFNTIK